MPPVLPRETIEEMARKIAERFHPERIILFGSYARGEATEDSDLDLYIEVLAPGPLGKRSSPIRRMLGEEYLFPFDLIVRSPEAMRERGSRFGTLEHEVSREGVVLYARSG
jgi:predicted nucleotidyltransferase